MNQCSSDSYYSYSASTWRCFYFQKGGGKHTCLVHIENWLPTRWLSVQCCLQQNRIVNRHMDKGAKDWKIMNHALFLCLFFLSPLPASDSKRRLCYYPPRQSWKDSMKHRIHGKEVEQPYIIIFLAYGGDICCGDLKPSPSLYVQSE